MVTLLSIQQALTPLDNFRHNMTIDTTQPSELNNIQPLDFLYISEDEYHVSIPHQE